MSAYAISVAAARDLAGALPPLGNEAPTGSSLAQVEPFNQQAREALHLMLDGRKDHSRERTTITEKHKYIRWLTEATTDKHLSAADRKSRSWVKSSFVYESNKLWKLPGNRFYIRREVITDEKIFDTIATVHNSSGHCGQESTAKKVNNDYYGIASHETIFLVKFCEIYHRKAPS